MQLKNTAFLLAISLLAMGCRETDDAPASGGPSQILDGAFVGTLVGTYSITHDYSTESPRTESGPVRLEVTGDQYRLSGERRYVPPGGCGTIRIGSVVSFKDECVHTAEFDWTLIIEGDFVRSSEGGKIALERYDARFDRLHRFELKRD